MVDTTGETSNDREKSGTDLTGSERNRTETDAGAQSGSSHESSGLENSSALGSQSARGFEGITDETGRTGDLQSVDEPIGAGDRGAAEQSGLVTQYDREASTSRSENGPVNWVFEGVAAGGPKSKFQDNIAALNLLKELEESGLTANPEQQSILAKYVGWGGLPQAFDASNSAWSSEYETLKAILTQHEYSEARSSTLNAHYTPPEVIDGVYTALRQFGVKPGSNFLEPASGTGNFAGRNTLNPASMYMVELDPVSATISKHLYPESFTIQSGFERFIPKPDFFDVAIGNPPFGQYRIHDSRSPQLSRFSVHNYFIGKSVESVKPGGITAMVVSRHFMDAKKTSARSYIAEKAHFLGAIRLPNSTFKDNALTSVTTDIVFFQRKKGDEETNKDWVNTIDASAPGADATFTLNSYFAERPEQIIGQMRFRSSAHGPVADCFNDDDTGLLNAIEQRLSALPKDIAIANNDLPIDDAAENVEVNFDNTFVKIDSYFKLPENQIAVRTADVMGKPTYRLHQSKNKTEDQRISSAIDIRDTVYTLINLEAADGDVAVIERTRAKLNKLYDKHVKKYGFLSSQVNKSVLRNDPSYSLLASLEIDYDKGVSKVVAEKEGKVARDPSAKKAAILFKRVNQPRKRIESVENAKDALVVCLNEYGRVDIEYIAQLTKSGVPEVIEELRGLIYKNPESNSWETSSKYLSGDVKKKLKIAQNAGDEFSLNTIALLKVVPEDIDAVDIGIQINSTWIPPHIISEFITSELSLAKFKCYVDYQPTVGRWIVELEGGAQSLRQEKWGTDKLDANEIITRLMMNSEIKVNKRVGTNEQNQPIYRVDIEATLEAQSKAEEIQNTFMDWVWREPERRNLLARIYNDTLNTHVPVNYDGSHLTLPLASPDIKLRQHQKNAVWRAIQEGTGLFDHAVGAGKTFATVATVMEGRRMGTFKKPLITVPNGLLNQWKDEFYTLYPGANVLVADKSDFEKENRRTLFARIASGDWDAVIVGHSSFQFIGVNPEEEKAFIDEQVEGIEEAIRNAKSNGGQRDLSIKQLERAKKTIQKKVEESSDSGRKDDLLTFDQLGVDALFVDEADTFKNLSIITAHSNIAGLGSTTPTQKCTDLFLKVRSLQKRNDGKGVYFLTGTPISNSIAELYTMQRYLQFDTLKDKNLLAFDAWASTFGQITSDWELDATGMNYRINNRFGKFNNVPELMRMYRTFADVVTQKDLAKQAAEDGTGRLVPKVAGGKPQNVICERSPLQEQYMGVEVSFTDEEGKPVLDAIGRPVTHWNSGSIIDRMVNRREGDNALNVTMDARLAALDFRIIDPNVPDWEKSKINAAAERIFTVWQKNDYRRGTQLVFCDLSTPKGRSGSINLTDEVEESEDETLDISMSEILMRRRQPSSFSAYEELFRKLVSMGMPAEQIRFIQDAKNEAQQQDLYNQVNNGDVRVLIGSTSKMGAGVNVQKRLVAQHHLDCPWRPRDMEQRDGRIIRQGNLFFAEDRDGFEVEIYRYATEKTYDARMWQTIEVKARAIEQFRNGTLEDRTIEDVAGEAASAAEMKAAATGNPLMFMQVQIDANKRKAETHYRSWQRVQHAQQARRAELPERIERLGQQISQHDNFSRYLETHSSDTSFTAAGRTYQTRLAEGQKKLPENELSDLQNYIASIAQRACDRASQAFDQKEALLGQYKGVDVYVKGYIPTARNDFKAYPEFLFAVNGEKLETIRNGHIQPFSVKYSQTDSLTVKGLFTRIDNALNSFPSMGDEFKSLLQSFQNEKVLLDDQQGGEYPGLKQLEMLRRDSVEVMAELRKSQEDSAYVSEWQAVSLSAVSNDETAIENIASVAANDAKESANDSTSENKEDEMPKKSSADKTMTDEFSFVTNTAKVNGTSSAYQTWTESFNNEIKKINHINDALNNGFDISLFADAQVSINSANIIGQVLSTNFESEKERVSEEISDAIEKIDISFMHFVDESTAKLSAFSEENVQRDVLDKAYEDSVNLLKSSYVNTIKLHWGDRFDEQLNLNEQAQKRYYALFNAESVTLPIDFLEINEAEAKKLALNIIDADVNATWQVKSGTEVIKVSDNLNDALATLDSVEDIQASLVHSSNEVVATRLLHPDEDVLQTYRAATFPLFEAIEAKGVQLPEFEDVDGEERRLARIFFMLQHFDGEISYDLSEEISNAVQDAFGLQPISGLQSASIPLSWQGITKVVPRVLVTDDTNEIVEISNPLEGQTPNAWTVELLDGTDREGQWHWFATRDSENNATRISQVLNSFASHVFVSMQDTAKVQANFLDELVQDSLVKAHDALMRNVPSAEQTDAVLSNQITWLNVPYIERKQAAAAAGKMDNGESWIGFDEDLKLWFAKPGADLTTLKQWIPDDLNLSSAAQDAVQEFADVLIDNGFLLDGLPVMDGVKHRVKVEGDKNGQTSGVYRAFTDGRPAGWFINFKVHADHQKWVSGTVRIDPAERANLRAVAAQKRQDRDDQQRFTYDSVAKWVREFVGKLKDAGSISHDYLKRKLVPATTGVKIDNDGNLIIPLQNVKSEVRSMETITPEGIKSLKKDSELAGNFFIVGDDGRGFDNAAEILYAEGYATAASIHMATGKPVVMCVAANNIPLVAKALYEQYPNAKHCFFADDDHAKEMNAGITKASQARDLTKGNLFIPIFNESDRNRGFTDFNDVHTNYGIEVLNDMVVYLGAGQGVSWGLSNALSSQVYPGYPLAENDSAEMEYAAAASLFEEYIMGEDNGDAVRLAAKHAADSGSAAGHFLLASCYTDGIGITPDMKMAFEHLKVAQGMGSADASYRLGEIYEHGIEGQPQDLKASRIHYAIAAQNPELKKLATAAVSRIDKQLSVPINYEDLRKQHLEAEVEIRSLKAEIDLMVLYETDQSSRMFSLGNGVTFTCWGEQSHDANLQKHMRICMSEASKERVSLSAASATKEVGEYRGVKLVVKSEEGKFSFGLVAPEGTVYEPETLVFQKGVRETFNLGEIIGSIDTYITNHQVTSKSKDIIQQKVDSLVQKLEDMDKILNQQPSAPAPKPSVSSSVTNRP